jgi:hypothetical protein
MTKAMSKMAQMPTSAPVALFFGARIATRNRRRRGVRFQFLWQLICEKGFHRETHFATHKELSGRIDNSLATSPAFSVQVVRSFSGGARVSSHYLCLCYFP